ncbi:MAG: hypothetical protein ACK5HZ_02800 [Macellibacteroides fermentans]|uniref:hypothetical protein n=1 Tax=Macellibacteroides fermentans TaxID=879969 RepID=UPI003AC87A9B
MKTGKLIKDIQPHSQEYLTEMFKNAGYPSQFYPRFLLRYTRAFNDFKSQYNDCDESDLDCSVECIAEEVIQDALAIITEYSRVFMKSINIGHGEEWSDLVASYGFYSDDKYDEASHYAYLELRKNDKELARKELSIYSKFIDEDELFEKHYVFLCERGERCDLSEEEVARNYSKIYKQQIALGKSEVYSHYYAERNAYNIYPELYCSKFAYAIEQAILKGFSRFNAIDIADSYANAIVNGWHYVYLHQFTKEDPGNIKDEELEDFILNVVLDYELRKIKK